MDAESSYFKDNKHSWNQCAQPHASSKFYSVSQFKSDPTYLSGVIRFNVPRLPRLEGLHVAHLMCHIGTDTLSLARLGAASVTGLDFSSASLLEARSLASATYGSGGERLTFIEGNAYDSVELLGLNKFDMIYTGVGVLCWLPRIRDLAITIAQLLKPGGKFFIREGHPLLWATDETITPENPEEQIKIVLPYFEQPQPMTFDDSLAYVEDSLQSNRTLHRTHQFNHGIGEIVQALLDAGLRITMLMEHETVPWLALPGRMVHTGLYQEYELKNKPAKIPLSFTIQAIKEDRSI